MGERNSRLAGGEWRRLALSARRAERVTECCDLVRHLIPDCGVFGQVGLKTVAHTRACVDQVVCAF